MQSTLVFLSAPCRGWGALNGRYTCVTQRPPPTRGRVALQGRRLVVQLQQETKLHQITKVLVPSCQKHANVGYVCVCCVCVYTRIAGPLRVKLSY
jgi:hypothetical protein